MRTLSSTLDDSGQRFKVVPTAPSRNWPGIYSGKRALGELGIEWKNVMAFGVHSDRVVII